MSPLLPDHIVQSIRDICRNSDAHLLDIVVRGSAQKRLIEVYADSESGITLDLCGKINREIGELLEKEQLFAGQYRLDVSSPGTDRPLEYPWQYRKHSGRLLKVTLTDNSVRQGRLREIGTSSFTLEVLAGKRDTVQVEIPFDDVRHAVVELEW